MYRPDDGDEVHTSARRRRPWESVVIALVGLVLWAGIGVLGVLVTTVDHLPVSGSQRIRCAELKALALPSPPTTVHTTVPFVV